VEGGNCTSLRADDSVQSTAQETVESEGLREHFIIECSASLRGKEMPLLGPKLRS
jgi:hypothetical protein